MIYLGIVSILWSFSFGIIKYGLPGIDSAFISFMRTLIALIFFSTLKLALNLIIFRFNKVKQNIIKLSACCAFILKRGSYFRIKHKV